MEAYIELVMMYMEVFFKSSVNKKWTKMWEFPEGSNPYLFFFNSDSDGGLLNASPAIL